ncbi:MAG: type II secretion system F family protein [Candidatus Omnitrophica bacterium]|nr:type II secretion system F family protein [Candidatus Omnitrophota bacterium]
MILIIILFVLGAVVLITYSIFPYFLDKMKVWQEKQERVVAKEMDNMFYDKNPKNLTCLYFILPFVLGIAGYFIFHNFIFSIIGIVAGVAIPNFILKICFAKRKAKFADQFLDAINLLSSSLKGGLSLLQAFEVVVEEMPVPISQEFGLVVRENRMGVSFEESLEHLKKRMDIEELGLMVNSILVARETGGALTKVFSRLSVTIRDNRKLKENIKTLTLQGRLQGLIMSFLPIVFVLWVVSVDRNHFDIMLQNDLGRMLLIIAVILQIVGMFLIRKFSTIKL